MARYRDANCKLCRREGEKLFLKGSRCLTDKCAVERRPFAPGQHGQGRRRKISPYGLQLREKQKIKRMYGLSEKQFHLFFERADRQKGITGTNLVVLLERRLDNVVFRLGFANSRAQARQLAGLEHGQVQPRHHRLGHQHHRFQVLSVKGIPQSRRHAEFMLIRRRRLLRTGRPAGHRHR